MFLVQKSIENINTARKRGGEQTVASNHLDMDISKVD